MLIKKEDNSAKHALMLADERKERFKRHRKFSNKIERDIRSFIEDEQWSPEQIIGHCKRRDTNGEP